MKKKTWRFVVVCISISLVGGLAVWGSIKFYESAQAPVSAPSALVLSEAARGERVFFMGYIGCPAPDVWQNRQVLENLKLMVEKGVEVKLIGSRRPFAHWSDQFVAKLLEYGIDPGIYTIGEMPNYSVVAGSNRRARAYICMSQADNRYPTRYFLVRSNELSLAWKNYLRDAFVAAKEGHIKQPD